MSTAQDLPLAYAEAGPSLSLVPDAPLDFDDAVRRVRPRLQRYAARRLGDLHEAEELVQEALLRAYSHRMQLRTEDDLAAWATVVTGRLVIDRLRVRGRSTSVADVPETSRVGRDTADVVVARDEARLALDSLDAMPSRQAALLWAREVEGRSYDELCSDFRMTEPAVRSVLTRARKALRKEYAARGGTLPIGGLAVLAPWVLGLTWADRLRKVASRAVTPAALGVAGIGAIGGLALSPFSLAPATTPGTFRPTPAVVATPVEPAPLHGPAARPTTLMSRALVAPAALSPLPVLPKVGCAGSEQAPSVNDGTCAKNAEVQGNVVYVGVPLPENPTGIRYVVVNTNAVECAQIPTNPVVMCGKQDPSSPAGATQ